MSGPGRSPESGNLRGFRPEFSDLAEHIPLFDTLVTTAYDLQQKLSSGSLKSTQIVEEYQRAICKYNSYLNAVEELASGAMARAQELDDLRAAGTVLGPLHGIPVLIKGNFDTHPSMGLHTANGALALLDSEPAQNAIIVDKMLDAGLIIMGKATLSELCWVKGVDMPCAFSATAGQGQSAYVFGGYTNDTVCGHSSPSGSSSGSAVAVSAGLCPVSFGTETFGSLCYPAARAGIYTIKPSLGIVPNEGIMPISRIYDIAGPLAHTPRDVAAFLDVIVDSTKTTVPPGGYASATASGSWDDIKVGSLDIHIWSGRDEMTPYNKPIDDEIDRGILEAYDKIKGRAKSYRAIVNDMTENEFMIDGDHAVILRLTYDLKSYVDSYLAKLAKSSVRSLQQLVDWNEQNIDKSLPPKYHHQEHLVNALKEPDANKSERFSKIIKHVGARLIKVFDDNDVDVLIAPGDSFLMFCATSARCPIASVPVGYARHNGRRMA